jgi:hypothetical protein
MLPDTEGGDEEIDQRARFRVTPAGGVQSAWTAVESSGVLVIAN